MSNVVIVRATTVFETDYNANIDKFYTAYSLGPYEIRQWGRVGVIGQFSIQRHPSDPSARNSAHNQIVAKERKGYTSPPGRQEVTFQFDIDKLGSNPGKDQAKWVAHAKDAYVHSGAGAPAPAAEGNTAPRKKNEPLPKFAPVQADRFEDFTDRALKAITQAVTDPAKAGVTYAKLNEEWEELVAITEKAQSYLSTLDQLVSSSMA